MKKIQTIDDVEAFLLKHGENIVDMLGGEIDRIELKLRVRNCLLTNKKRLFFESGIQVNLFLFQKKFPQIRHCDLEIL